MGRTYNPMIHVTGGATTISGITIDGQQTPTLVDGIYADGAGTVTISGVTIKNIGPSLARCGNIFPCALQSGSAIIIIDPMNATIQNNQITNIQKNSLDFASNGILIATGNTITGPGVNSNAAQNGIVVRGGTATLNNNTISGMKDDTIAGSACITAIGGAVTGDGNNLSNCDIGVNSDGSYASSTGSVPSVTLTNTTTSGNTTDVVEEGGGTASVTGPTPRATATSVPTIGDGALAVLGLLLAGLATVVLRRRPSGGASA